MTVCEKFIRDDQGFNENVKKFTFDISTNLSRSESQEEETEGKKLDSSGYNELSSTDLCLILEASFLLLVFVLLCF